MKEFPPEGGSVINISSVAATMAPPLASVYSATKGAVDTITLSLSKELGSKNIRVNSVSPGLVETEGNASLRGSDMEKGIVASTPWAAWASRMTLHGR